MGAYRGNFDKTKCMSLFIKDEKFGKKINNIIEKEIDSTPVYNEKYLKTKLKS